MSRPRMAAGWLKLQLRSHAPTFANVKAFFLMKTSASTVNYLVSLIHAARKA